ncbi:MAG: hypothetical protein ACREQN_17625 [Candidatus Binataceae bacterium]
MRAQIGEAADRRHMAPISSATLWVILCGVVVIVLHAATREFGAHLGSYRTGLITIIAFALAILYSARKRTLWFTVRWLRWAMLLPRPLALRFVLSNRLETWRFAHITIGVAAMLPFWWHTQAGPASTLELALKCAVVLLVLSGLTGTFIQDFLPHTMRMRRDQEVRLEDVDAGFHALYVEAEESILGHSEQLVHVYLRCVRPILVGTQPALKMMQATLTGSDPALAVCASARGEADALGAEGAIYAKLVDIAERKVRLEHNQFNLELSTGWLSFHVVLALITVVLIIFHVAGVLYFAGL